MVEGTLIAKSLRPGAELVGIPLVVRKISRAALGDASAGQPDLWTFVEFETDDADADRLAGLLADALDRAGGWYTGFRSPA